MKYGIPKRLRRPLARLGRNAKRANLKEFDECLAQQFAKEECDEWIARKLAKEEGDQ